MIFFNAHPLIMGGGDNTSRAVVGGEEIPLR